MYMLFRVPRTPVFISAKQKTSLFDCPLTMQARFSRQDRIGHGIFSRFIAARRVRPRAGWSSRSNRRSAEETDGWVLRGYAPEGAKRRYEAHFISKLTDCDGENGETDSSLDFARDCEYISIQKHAELSGLCCDIGKMLGAMMRNPQPFLISDVNRRPPISDLGRPPTD